MGSAYRRWLSWMCLLLLGCCWGSPALAAQSSLSPAAEPTQESPQLVRDSGAEHFSLAEARQRLEAIAEAMRSIRLCSRPNCRYRDISVEVRPIAGAEPPEYEGRIDAAIDRPSGSLDRAHYRLRFRGGRWQLLGGEEVSDVSSFFFEGDTYEVFSAYGSRKGKLADASSSLRVGYRELYYRVFDRGQERWP